jgi:hypothetical protein
MNDEWVGWLAQGLVEVVGSIDHEDAVDEARETLRGFLRANGNALAPALRERAREATRKRVVTSELARRTA